MQPQKPYLVRAFYDWIVESQCTPYVLVDATLEGVLVPQEYVEDGEIVLNISNAAVLRLEIDNEKMTFEARFSGLPTQIVIPITSIMALYANENGRGMVFKEELDEGDSTPPPVTPPTTGKPHLKIIK